MEQGRAMSRSGTTLTEAEVEGLRRGLDDCCPDLDVQARQRAADSLLAYAAILSRWAPTTNLVSLGDLPLLATHHLLPSLSLRETLRTVCHDRIVDVGSGAGLPGIPLAVTLPESTFWLVESRRRRASFLRQVARSIGLPNVEVVHARVEAWEPEVLVDCAVSRAVGSGDQLSTLTRGCLAPHGALLVTLSPSSTVSGNGPQNHRHRVVWPRASGRAVDITVERGLR